MTIDSFCQQGVCGPRGVAAPSLATTLASLPCDELIGLVDLLWMKGDHERRMVCVELLELYRDRLTAADVALLETPPA